MHKILPLFMVQPKLILVDDDLLLLESIKNHFEPTHEITVFSDPRSALNYIKEKELTLPAISIKDLITQPCGTLDLNHQNLVTQFDFESMQQFIQQIKQQTLLLIVDQNMPQISGIELCGQINYNMKKILLTGSQNLGLAIDAFNAKLINGYVRKDVDATIHKLSYLIDENLIDHFKHLSYPLAEGLSSLGFSYATDSKFIETFYQILKSLSIVEYYIINQNAEFYLKNLSGKGYNLIFRTKQMLYDGFIGPFSNIPELSETINKVANYNFIPYFGNSNVNNTAYNQWEQYLHKSSRFDTDLNSYFYICIEQ